MMKKIILSALMIFAIVSCTKDSVEKSSGFVAFAESDADYTTRSCFQLSDGNYIICGSNIEWPAGNTFFGTSTAIMAKFSRNGDLILQKDLPGSLFDLWRGVSIPTGGFVLAGLDSMTENSNIIITLFNNNGEAIRSNSVFNLTGPTSNSRNQVSITRLSNGNIAMVLMAVDPTGNKSCPRLLIFDPQLNIVKDKIYDSMFSAIKNYKNSKVSEGKNGKIYLCGVAQEFSAWSWTYLMGIDGTTYERDFFTERLGGDTNSYPSPFTISNAGHVIIPTANQYKAGIYFNASNYFYYHLDEYYSIGKTVSAVETDENGNFIARHQYSGFSGYGTLTGITKASDGGFLLVGTCGLVTDAILNSPFRILVIKTNDRLEQQWMKQINTTYPAVGVDVTSTDDGGFLIGAYQKSFGSNYKMMMIKMDVNGGMWRHSYTHLNPCTLLLCLYLKLEVEVGRTYNLQLN